MYRFFLLLALISSAFSLEVGSIDKLEGRVDVLKKEFVRGIAVRETGMRVEVGDIVRTKRGAYASVSFIDGSRVELFELTRLKVLSYEKSRELHLQRGVVKFEVESLKGLKGFKVRTPHAIVGVKGTTFWVYVYPGYTVVVLKEGNVSTVYRYVGALREWKGGSISEAKVRKEPFSDKPPQGGVNLEVILR